jgi:eukaryotic-like serine/threonine-protein kinase
MDLDRFKQVEDIFCAVIVLPPAERLSFLEQSCGDDETLRSEVESLLSFDETYASVIDTPPESLAAELLAAPQRSQIIGKTIGRYQILSLLGKGGMGEVYLAEDGELQRKAALKFLPAEFLNSEERLRRFAREARAASALNHPNILTIYEIGNDNGLRFIASELVIGITLREKLRSGPLAFTEALEVAEQIASALGAAHAGGIVHRDIKPENIMLRRDGLVKVLDFGLAKLAEANPDPSPTSIDARGLLNTQVKTNPSAMMGTPTYMSPEQAQGVAVDARTDIFSLGIVLYEMLTGKPPFAGETSRDVIAAILQNEPSSLGASLDGLPRELESIVEKSLRKSREERYQTIDDLLLDLRDLKSELDFQSKLERSSPSHRTDETSRDSRGRVSMNANVKPLAAAVSTSRPASRAAYILELTRRHKALAVICLLVGATFIGFGGPLLERYFGGGATPLRANSVPVRQTRVTTVGAAREAKVSPDGQSVAYISQEGAQYAMYLWQAAENRTLPVLPPENEELTKLDFAPDGQHVYYRQKDQVQREFHNLYRVPTFGGASEKLVTDIDSSVSFGPGGREIAFRREVPDDQKSLILIANADGTGERVLVERDRSEGFSADPAWSPDGKTIVSWGAEAIPDIKMFLLVAINVADGSMSPLSSQRWRWPKMVTWMPDGKEILVNGIAHAGERNQIYRAAYPGGDMLRVTNDFNNYEGVSVTADGASLVTLQGRQDISLYVAPADEPMNLQRVTEVTGVTYYGLAWTPDGQIVYSSNAGGQRNIWMMEADGSHLQQITNDNFVNENPTVTPDGRYIVYTCERTGRPNIWRRNLDGSNPVQLTDGDIELRPSITSDSQWVVFERKKNGVNGLGKVSIDGGEVREIIPQGCIYPKVSPDGRTVACEYLSEAYHLSLSIFPMDGGKPIKSFVPRPGGWQWAADSQSLIFVEHTAGYSNLFRASMANNSRKQLTNFKSDHIFAYAFSPDDKKMAMLRGSQSSDVVMLSNFH